MGDEKGLATENGSIKHECDASKEDLRPDFRLKSTELKHECDVIEKICDRGGKLHQRLSAHNCTIE